MPHVTEEQCHDYLEQELTKQEEEEFELEVNSCAQCSDLLQQVASISVAIDLAIQEDKKPKIWN